MKLNKLKDKVLSHKGNNDLALWHHVFMRKYGWIPFDEFKRLPCDTFCNLQNEIIKEINEQIKQSNKSKKGK